MNVNFYLDRNKTTKDVKTIWCYVRSKENSIYLNTKEKANFQFWDKKSQRVNLRKIKNPSQKSSIKALNEYLDAYESKVNSIVRTLRLNNPLVSDLAIIEELHKQFKKPNPSFFSSFDEFITAKGLKVTKGGLKKYKRAKSLLIEFEADTNYKLTFDSINRRFYDKIIPYLTSYKGKGFQNNTITRFIMSVKTFMNWAVECNLTDNTSYKSYKASYDENEIIYLTEAELDLIYNLDLSDDEKLDRTRDIFLFQCFTGVRYSDISNIKREDIRNNFWYFKTLKTKDDLSIPLQPKAVAILHKYNEYPQPLPVISNQKMNKYIKEVCEKAGIKTDVRIIHYKGTTRVEKVLPKFKAISTHTARRTFISLSIQKGMSAEIVMSITGHKTYRMMQKYLKVVEGTKRTEMEKVWGTNLRQV